MSDEKRFRTNDRVAAAKVYDDEVVVINTATGRYYDLEGCAPDIWPHLSSGTSVDRVAEVLARRYDVDTTEAAQDVERFIDRLVVENLVIEDDGTAAEPLPLPESNGRTKYLAPTVTTFTDMEELLAADPPMPSQYTPVWEAPTNGGA